MTISDDPGFLIFILADYLRSEAFSMVRLFSRLLPLLTTF